MKIKKIITITNVIAGISVAVLLCWVVITITVSVFGLKVLQERSSTLFFSSVGVILTLMFGALILNMMLNLTRIADKHNADKEKDTKSMDPKKAKKNKIISIALWLSLPLLVAFLFFGDYISTKEHENMLRASADLIVEENSDTMAKITEYSFDEEWVNETSESLDFLSMWDRNYPSITVIVQDTVNGKNTYLEFTRHSFFRSDDEDAQMDKMNYIFESNMDERLYLNSVFEAPHGEAEKRFTSYGNNYEFFYPITSNGKTMVLVFNDRDSYGIMSK